MINDSYRCGDSLDAPVNYFLKWTRENWSFAWFGHRELHPWELTPQKTTGGVRKRTTSNQVVVEPDFWKEKVKGSSIRVSVEPSVFIKLGLKELSLKQGFRCLLVETVFLVSHNQAFASLSHFTHDTCYRGKLLKEIWMEDAISQSIFLLLIFFLRTLCHQNDLICSTIVALAFFSLGWIIYNKDHSGCWTVDLLELGFWLSYYATNYVRVAIGGGIF